VLQFVCDVVKDTGEEEYLCPFVRIGLDFPSVSNAIVMIICCSYKAAKVLFLNVIFNVESFKNAILSI